MKKSFYLFLSLFIAISLFSQDNSTRTIEDLQNEINNLVKVNDQLRAEIARLKSEKSSMSNTSNNGEEYRIQLGIQNNAIGSLTSPKVVAGTMVNGKMVYDIGGFQNPNDAFLLSQELRKLNLAGSFVTRYFNGTRDFSYRFEPGRTPSSSSYSSTPVNNPAVNYSQSRNPIKNPSASSNNAESGSVDMEANRPAAKKSTVLVIED